MKKKIKGETAIFFSSLLYTITAVLIKSVSTKFDGFFISTIRFLIAIILGIAILKLKKMPFKVYDKKSWILRGVFGSTAMILYYVAIQITSSGRATLLFNTYPIFVAIFGYLFFKENITRKNIVSLVFCISGVLFVFYDGSHYYIWGDVLGLIGGLIAGIAIHYIKRSSEKNYPLIVYLSACFFGMVLFPFSIHQAVRLTLTSSILLFLIGTLSLSGQLAMTYGYRYVQATKGSIISYSAIPLTIFLSYFIGEEFKTRFFIGIALILTGLLINRK